jgi:hypothetical protein
LFLGLSPERAGLPFLFPTLVEMEK